MRNFFPALFVGSAVAYALWSFILTDPNLVFTSWQPYWEWQNWLWHTLLPNHVLTTQIYVAILGTWFAAYIGILAARTSLQKNFFLLAITIGVLFFSNNALSHDVFNYLFNAKMVAIYHANPHVRVALDFSTDTWTRFMHNTHTPAPYGYGWTAISLIPFAVGLGKFLPSWLAFRAMSVLAAAWLVWVWQRHPNAKHLHFLPVLLNPLFLIEVVSNSHNDLWMIVPALWAMVLMAPPQRRTWQALTLSTVLLLFSVSIKFATLALLPLWMCLVFFPEIKTFTRNLAPVITQYWAEAGALLMAVPLFTARSQQFHPWYFLWVLCWLPWMKTSWLRLLLLAFTASSLLRYIPGMLGDSHTNITLTQEKMFTWGGGIILFATLLLYRRIKRQQP